MDGVVQDINAGVLGKALELLRANGGRFEINQLLLAEDAAPVTSLHNSTHQLCRLVSEFGRVCERQKLE